MYHDDKVDKLCKLYQYIRYCKQREAIQNNLRKYGYSNRNPTALHTSMVTFNRDKNFNNSSSQET